MSERAAGPPLPSVPFKVGQALDPSSVPSSAPSPSVPALPRTPAALGETRRRRRGGDRRRPPDPTPAPPPPRRPRPDASPAPPAGARLSPAPPPFRAPAPPRAAPPHRAADASTVAEIRARAREPGTKAADPRQAASSKIQG